MAEKRESWNKSVAVVIKDENRLSKHSSMTSEVDLVVAETSISEAKVERLSSESFVVLETGTTMKLSIDTAKHGREENNNTDHTESIDEARHKQSENTTMKTTVTREADDMEIKGENAQDDTTKKQIIRKTSTKSKDNGSAQQPTKDSDEIVADENGSVQARTETDEVGEKKIDDQNKTNLSDDNEGMKSQMKEQTKQEHVNDFQLPKLQVPVDDELGKTDEDKVSKTDSQKEIMEVNKPTETNEDKTQSSISNIPSPYSSALVPIEDVKTPTVLLPETVALVAKQLTTTLAKQMVETTTCLGREMVGAVNDLTVYNGSTLELADVDYFVIYKADSHTVDDGIRFIARMELGSNAITKIVPFSPTKAWVSYFGGGIKLIDIEKECTLYKFDVPGLESIATTGENFLFTSSCLTHYAIDKMHIVGEESTGTMPYIKFAKSRIACMTMSNAGDRMMVCIEKMHSFLCFPGKSEINVQIYGLRGKRLKELRPKVDGTNLRTTYGFPIGMCENINGDICLSSFNRADHTCAVEVFDKNLERRFEYRGEKNQQQKFMCEDICTDKFGNILLLDNCRKSVHIINKDGDFVKMISTIKYQIENPKCINVDPSGKLWIGQGPPAQVIILEYTV